ncbi:hypothetical protein BB560_003086, partial [Smittium megazygosporum]
MYIERCPFCNKNTPETIEHMLIECFRRNSIRHETTVFNISRLYRTVTIDQSTNNQDLNEGRNIMTSLNEAGVIGQKAVLKNKGKKKAKSNGGPDAFVKERLASKLKQIQQELNPFDRKFNVQKDSVLGRKLKGASGNPGLSHRLDIEKRDRTILQELERGTKTGGIRDKRFGENNPEVSVEEKMLERFTKEKQRKIKKSDIYNLSDNESGEDMLLTHMGQNLNDIDDFDAAGLGLSDDEDKGNIDASTVKYMHFGGFELAKPDNLHESLQNTTEKKSRAQVMKEIISKSKMHKHERQLAKEEDLNIRNEIDDDFDELRDILASDGNLKTSNSTRDQIGKNSEPEEKGDDSYDTAVRSLIFDQRAKPTDRLKTEEEIIAERKEFLERAERHRIPSKKSAKVDDSADRLDDDFDYDNSGSDSKEEDSDESGMSSDNEDGQDSSDSSSEVESQPLSSAGNNQNLNISKDASNSKKNSKTSFKSDSKDNSIVQGKGSEQEIPFTFKCPENYKEWIALSNKYSLEQQVLIIERLCVLYHPSLSPQNISHCENLIEIFSIHLGVLCDKSPPVAIDLINKYVEHISKLIALSPAFAGNYYREWISDFESRLQDSIVLKEGSQSTLNSKVTPLPSDLFISRMLVSVFSSSDEYHPVITPLLIVLNQYLSLSSVSSVQSFVKYLIVAGVVHESIRLSRRYIPEIMSALQLLLYSILVESNQDNLKSFYKKITFPASQIQQNFFSLLVITKSELDSQKPTNKKKKKSQGFKKSDDNTNLGSSLNENLKECDYSSLKLERAHLFMQNSQKIDSKLKLTMLRSTLVSIEEYMKLYSFQESFPEISAPFLDIITFAQKSDYFKLLPVECQEHIIRISEFISGNIKDNYSTRAPLTLQDHKPIPIRSVAPKFENEYSLDRFYNDNARFEKSKDEEDLETRKLRRLHKREQRGVIRELRKDA